MESNWLYSVTLQNLKTLKQNSIIYHEHGFGSIGGFTNKIVHLFYFAKYKQANVIY